MWLCYLNLFNTVKLQNRVHLMFILYFYIFYFIFYISLFLSMNGDVSLHQVFMHKLFMDLITFFHYLCWTNAYIFSWKTKLCKYYHSCDSAYQLIWEMIHWNFLLDCFSVFVEFTILRTIFVIQFSVWVDTRYDYA